MIKITKCINYIISFFIVREIHIFLNNKLITLDTILPVIFILKRKNKNINIIYYVFNLETYKLIKKNSLLMEAIYKTGKINYFNTDSSIRIVRFIQKINSAKMIIKILILSLFKRITYIHFKALNKWPFKILYIFNKKRTLYWSPDSHLKPKTIDLLNNLNYNIRGKRSRDHPDTKYSATALVSANKNWNALNYTNGKNIYFYKDLHLNKDWIEFLINNSKNYLDNKLKKSNLNLYVIIGGGGFGGKSGIIPYIVGLEAGVWKILEDIITTIDKIDNSIIYYKPHPNTNDNLKKQMEEKFKKYNIIFGNLHPAALCLYAKCIVVTHWSNTLDIPYKLGIPTIEYTNYTKEALEITNNQSPVRSNVSYFIQNDKNKLYDKLRIINSSDIKLKIPKEKNLMDTPDIINKIVYEEPY